MKLEHSFEVRAPVEEVWRTLIDIERVSPCLPGADITERDEDGTYRGDFKVKLGPTTAAYRGTLKMESLDEDAHVATMLANGQDKRGQGSAKATVVSRMSESGGVTRVEVETDFSITGKLARFGRGGMIKDVSSRLLDQFAACLQAGFEEGEDPGESGSTGARVAEPDPAPTATPISSEAVTSPEIDPGGPPAARGASAPSRGAFKAPPRSEPIGGLGLVSGVLLDRAAPLLLVVLGALRRVLERLESVLRGRAGGEWPHR